ncbi:MAG: phenylalanine--tRNA ligase subunit beta, partial [Actinomycetota bacterium]|nr:phenylalanine--tRNA ligase subunit beta [Actinomycetota bacterium]
VVAAVCSGPRRAQAWSGPAEPWDFFALKGALEAALGGLGITGFEFTPVDGVPFHPTRAARVGAGGAIFGAIGEIHPDVCERFEVPEGTVAFEVALAAILAAIPGRPRVEELPKFPPILIDLAVVVDQSIPAGAVETIITEAGAPEVESVRLFDLYRGDQIEAGKKSLAYALQLRAPDRTMTDDEAAAVRNRIIAALADRTGAQLRS